VRICIVSSEFPPFSGGGIGTYTEITSRALARAGHQVHVIANAWVADPAGVDLRLELGDDTGNLRVHRVPALDDQYRPYPPHDQPHDALGTVCRERDCSVYWSLRAADTLAELSQEVDLDVVEFPECFAEGYVSLHRRGLIEAPIDLPMTLTLHSPMREIAHYNLLQRTAGWVERRAVIEDLAIAAADSLSAPSRLLGRMVAHRLGLEDPVAWIPNSMDFDRLEGLVGTVVRDPETPPHLLYVGRLEPRKGVRQLVDAAAALMVDRTRLTVHLVGQDCPAGDAPGSMREALLRRIPRPLRPRFRFEDKLPRRDLFARFARATAIVFAPEWDNFPYTCCEAMAAGGAVIVSDHSGMADMVEHDRSGLVVAAGDVPDLAGAITRVLDETGLAARLGVAAAARIRELCDPERIIPIKLAHYRKTIERHRLKRKARAAMSASTETVALLIRDERSTAEVRATVRSATIAARHAGVGIDISVAATERRTELARLLPEVTIQAAEEDQSSGAALGQWLDRVRSLNAGFLMTMRPGETLDERYLGTVLRVLQRHDDAAWATTWALPVDGGAAGPFAGFDFTAPLELMYYHPVPFALVRRAHFEQTGGWNLDLPDGWREWDLWLAFLGQGLQGVVVPVWQAHHLPDSGRPAAIDHGKAYEMALEAIVERHRELFREHGATLWIAGKVGRTSPPGVPLPGDSEPAPLSTASAAADTATPAVRRQVHYDLLHRLGTAEITAEEGHVGEAAFFDAHPLGGRTLLAHPPSRITYRGLDIGERSFLNLTLAMHPAVYTEPGGGVRFIVRLSGRTVLDEHFNPKSDTAARGWKDLSIDLASWAGPNQTLELETRPWPGDDSSFCTAGWGRAHLAADPFGPPPEQARFVLR
jgi:glycosyltransferase involved in cell wall biosynthesis